MECTPSMTITSMYSAKVASSYAFVASRAQSWVLEDHILHDSGICSMDDDYVSTLACLRDKLDQHMSPVEYRTISKYRLMIPLFFVDAICPVCRKACLDSFGEHAVYCKELSGFKYQHDMVRDANADRQQQTNPNRGRRRVDDQRQVYRHKYGDEREEIADSSRQRQTIDKAAVQTDSRQ
ncbi:hypothetical protein Tco_0603334 [Tanacetum coccineum]